MKEKKEFANKINIATDIHTAHVNTFFLQQWYSWYCAHQPPSQSEEKVFFLSLKTIF